jgi:RHS repeat-associated protein
MSSSRFVLNRVHGKHCIRTFANARLLAAAVALLIPTTSALAQAVQDSPPPVHYAIDAYGVNLIDGSFHFDPSTTTISVGTPGQGGISRSFTGIATTDIGTARDSLRGTINSSGSIYTVSLGGQSWTYSLSGSTFTSQQADGSTVTIPTSGTYKQVLRDGTIALFSNSYSNSDTLDGASANVAQITTLTRPNGEVLTYTYSFQSCSQPHGGSAGGPRLEAVTNNYGYEIKYLYSTSGGNPCFYQFRLSQVIALNNAIDVCPPLATSCTGLTVNWQSISFTWPADTVTDNLGRHGTYPYVGASSTKQWIKPSGEIITVVFDASTRVTSVSNGTGTWTYSYSDNAQIRTTTITDPNGHTRVVVSNTSFSIVLADTNGLSQKTSYVYDTNERVIKVTRPEGDYTSYTFDARGNTTQTVVTGRDLTSTITTSASFDATCAYPAKCNQPNWTKDGRGNETDFTYSTTTGQRQSIIRPAGANGLRPETDFTYAAQYAWYKNSSGTLVQASSSVSMPVTVSQCANAQTCPGTANAVKTTLTYGASGVANNLQPTQITNGSGDNSLIASTSFTYDAVGNMLTRTDSLGNLTRMRYDVARQLVGIIGPDPDGAGTLHNRAVRLTYECDSTVKSGCDGLVTLAEQGTTQSQSDADWSAFSTLGQTATTYDSIARKIVERVSNGSTYIRVVQNSYDNANRLTCSAVRMNPAAVLSLPASACTLGTAGLDGQDRITSFTYDNADKLLKSTSAYGTTVQADLAVYTYGANGEMQTQADGDGHLTTIVRDTFHRVYQVQFPNPSNGSVSSTTDYEQYAYDANSNITQNRRRDGTLVNYGYDALNLVTSGYNGATFGYDNLGRMTSAAITGLSLSFGYDGLSRQTSEVGPLGTVGRTYDLEGNPKRLTYPDGYYVTYNYDAANELTSIVDSSAVTLIQNLYDNLGRISQVTRAAGQSENRGYGSDLRLSSLAYSFADTAKNVTFTYTYNLAGQTKSATPSNSLYSWTSSRTATTYGSDGQNRYTTVGSTNISYDGRGNLSNGGATNFGYDGLNRLNTVGTASLAYDAINRLYQVTASSTTRFLYSGQQIVGEYDGSGSLLRRFVPGPALDRSLVWYEGTGTASSSARWLLANAFGSIVAVGTSGASNTTLGINTYDEFGSNAAGNIGRFQYKGMPWIPEAGLYHVRARAYSANLGRFMQPDPGAYSAGMNYYAFVHNAPLNGSDPLGLNDDDCSDYGCNVVVTGNRFHPTLPRDSVPALPGGVGGAGAPGSAPGHSSQGKASTLKSTLCTFFAEHGYVTAGFTIGEGLAGRLDVTFTRFGVSAFLGAGLGAGTAFSVTAGAQADQSTMSAIGFRGFASISGGLWFIGVSGELSAGTNGATGSLGGGAIAGLEVASGFGVDVKLINGDPAVACQTSQ